jgi:uncharacterized GH25 family protein
MSTIARSCFLLALLPVAAAAHPTWFAGNVVPLSERTQIDLELTTSHGFPKPELSLAPARVQRAVVVSSGGTIPLLVQGSRPDHLALRAVISGETAVWGVAQTKPSEIELDAETVAKYLEELGEPTAVRVRYEQQKRWRELYSKNAKVWVQLAQSPAPARMREPLNLPFELVPQQDLARVQPGASFTVCAFSEGKPSANAFISLTDAAGERRHVRADKTGCASIKRPDRPFLLESILIKVSEDEAYDWRSEFASLTVIPARPIPAATSASKSGTP